MFFFLNCSFPVYILNNNITLLGVKHIFICTSEQQVLFILFFFLRFFSNWTCNVRFYRNKPRHCKISSFFKYWRKIKSFMKYSKPMEMFVLDLEFHQFKFFCSKNIYVFVYIYIFYEENVFFFF